MLPETLYSFGYALQIASYTLTTIKVVRKGSVLGLSSDSVAYSWLWLTANAICGGLYLLSSNVSLQYAQRYPVYPPFQVATITFLLDVVGVVVTSILLYQTLYKLRHSRKGNEGLSMGFAYVVGLLALGLIWVTWTFCKGYATINHLDLANFGWLVSYVCFSFRLIPQCSVNWFFARFNVLHRHFMPMQVVSLLLLTLSLAGLRWIDTQWHDISVNYVSAESLLLNWLSLTVLGYQQYIYRPGQGSLPR